MGELATAFQHLRNVLTENYITSLKQACKRHLSQEEAIPSYTLIDSLDIPAFTKIKRTLEEQTGETLYYLNDFYIYTDDTFGASWHMDTELFTFEHALNAWILLSPNRSTDPLCFIDQLNDTPERYYHGLDIDGDD